MDKSSINRRIIIGGSQSTGSSLLRRVMERHPIIYGAPETFLFATDSAYRDWEEYRSQIANKKNRLQTTKNWVMHYGPSLTNGGLQPEKINFNNLLNTSTSLQEFADKLFTYLAGEKEPELWVEKTPSNAFYFKDFLEQIEDSVVIHICRNPLDTLASMYERGENLFYAAGTYLLSNYYALLVSDSPNYYRINYEDLTASPEKSLSKLCAYLDINFVPELLQSKLTSSEDVTQMKGWRFNETGEIKASPKSRFESISLKGQRQILNLCYWLEIGNPEQSGNNRLIGVNAIPDISQILGYHREAEKISGYNEHLSINSKYYFFRDHLARFRRGMQPLLSLQGAVKFKKE